MVRLKKKYIKPFVILYDIDYLMLRIKRKKVRNFLYFRNIKFKISKSLFWKFILENLRNYIISPDSRYADSELRKRFIKLRLFTSNILRRSWLKFKILFKTFKKERKCTLLFLRFVKQGFFKKDFFRLFFKFLFSKGRHQVLSSRVISIMKKRSSWKRHKYLYSIIFLARRLRRWNLLYKNYFFHKFLSHFYIINNFFIEDNRYFFYNIGNINSSYIGNTSDIDMFSLFFNWKAVIINTRFRFRLNERILYAFMITNFKKWRSIKYWYLLKFFIFTKTIYSKLKFLEKSLLSLKFKYLVLNKKLKKYKLKKSFRFTRYYLKFNKILSILKYLNFFFSMLLSRLNKDLIFNLGINKTFVYLSYLINSKIRTTDERYAIGGLSDFAFAHLSRAKVASWLLNDNLFKAFEALERAKNPEWVSWVWSILPKAKGQTQNFKYAIFKISNIHDGLKKRFTGFATSKLITDSSNKSYLQYIFSFFFINLVIFIHILFCSRLYFYKILAICSTGFSIPYKRGFIWWNCLNLEISLNFYKFIIPSMDYYYYKTKNKKKILGEHKYNLHKDYSNSFILSDYFIIFGLAFFKLRVLREAWHDKYALVERDRGTKTKGRTYCDRTGLWCFMFGNAGIRRWKSPDTLKEDFWFKIFKLYLFFQKIKQKDITLRVMLFFFIWVYKRRASVKKAYFFRMLVLYSLLYMQAYLPYKVKIFSVPNLLYYLSYYSLFSNSSIISKSRLGFDMTPLYQWKYLHKSGIAKSKNLVYKKFFMNIDSRYYSRYSRLNKTNRKKGILHLIEKSSNNFLVLSLFKTRRVLGHTSGGQGMFRLNQNKKRQKKGTGVLTRTIVSKLKSVARLNNIKNLYILSNTMWNFKVAHLTKYWVRRYKLGVPFLNGFKAGVRLCHHKGLRRAKKKRY